MVVFVVDVTTRRYSSGNIVLLVEWPSSPVEEVER
jgi:hypothetical protein